MGAERSPPNLPDHRRTEDFYRALGARIRQARKERRYTQAELGRLLGYSANAILGWEKGTRRVNVEDLVRLAAVLGRTASFFLEGCQEELGVQQQGGPERGDLNACMQSLLAEAVARLKDELTRTFRDALRSQEFREAVTIAVKEGLDRTLQEAGRSRGKHGRAAR